MSTYHRSSSRGPTYSRNGRAPARSCSRGRSTSVKEKLVLNKQDLNSIKQIAYEYPDVEFLYLRENDFDVFDPYIRLVDLKMLDLSLNNISSVAFLWGGALPTSGVGELALPKLRHLYLTGNCIESLSGLSYLNSLESLALSNNSISSFEGLGSLPNLKLLSLNFNDITTFKHLPFLPSLSAISLEGNPLASTPTYRVMTAAVCSAYLNKVDSVTITDGEMDIADRMQGKVAFCITEGFIPTSLDEDLVKAEADGFLLELQRKQSVGKPLKLQSISLGRQEDSPYKGSTPIEGIPVVLRVCLQVCIFLINTKIINHLKSIKHSKQDTRPAHKSRTDVFHSSCIFPVFFRVCFIFEVVLLYVLIVNL